MHCFNSILNQEALFIYTFHKLHDSCILPYAIKSTLSFILDTISALSRKKANKIGIMTAIEDLEDEVESTRDSAIEFKNDISDIFFCH